MSRSLVSSGSSSKRGGKKIKSLIDAEDDALTIPMLQVGDEAPDFTCDSTTGLFNFHEIIDGSFSVLVTFLYGFDPVATTEMGMLSKLKDEFQARECKLVTLCVDSKENHRKWIEEVHELQDCEVWFPVIADHNAEISRLLNLVKAKAVNAKRNLRPATVVMVMDIDRRIRFMQQYPSNIGRNFYEVLRVVDALQLSLFHQVVTPANWSQGEEVFIHPGLSSGAAAPMFPKGFNEVRDWCRVTAQPDV